MSNEGWCVNYTTIFFVGYGPKYIIPSTEYKLVTTVHIAPSLTAVQSLFNYSRKANERMRQHRSKTF